MNVFRTFNIPTSLMVTAQKIANNLSLEHHDMFISSFDENGVSSDTPLGYISSGFIDETSPLLDKTQLEIALQGTGVTQQEIDDFFAAQDLTDEDPFVRISKLSDEIFNPPVSQGNWVQPTGAQDAYPLDTVITYNTKTWVSLVDANVWEPGVSAWREVWASSTPPEWVQPTGAHDAYPLGAIVSHNGFTWQSDYEANVWEPGVFGWTQL